MAETWDDVLVVIHIFPRGELLFSSLSDADPSWGKTPETTATSYQVYGWQKPL